MKNPQRYQSKPFEVEAIRFTADNRDECLKFTGKEGGFFEGKIYIGSVVSVGDWIVKKSGKLIGLSDHRFREMFDLVNTDSDLINALRERIGDVDNWLKSPNRAFDGRTPQQVIDAGEEKILWQMIYFLDSGEPT